MAMKGYLALPKAPVLLDGLMSYQNTCRRGFYSSAEMQAVYSTSLADWVWFGLVSLFNGISTFAGYLTPKPFSKKNSSGTI